MARKRRHEIEVIDITASTDRALGLLDKKRYKNATYYKVQWENNPEPTWEVKSDCDSGLVKKFESTRKREGNADDDTEWEVEEILDKRINKDNEVEYLLKWRNWIGEPTWEREESCNCTNLIAAYENPKLRKMWNFEGNNPKLWLDRKPILKYMKRYARKFGASVNLLKFEPDIPGNEEPVELKSGLNIGPLSYRNHWYLIVILVNYICSTREILVGDPLNTFLGGADISVHPVYKRLRGLFPRITVKPIVMTPMDRSDMCAFYILAAYERALYLLQERAHYVAMKFLFDKTRTEHLRCKILPESRGELSASLPVPNEYLKGPQCEFCGVFYETSSEVDAHINRRHMWSSSYSPEETGAHKLS